MKKLEITDLSRLEGGKAVKEFVTGMCSGLTFTEAGIGLASVAATYGWWGLTAASIPVLGQAALVVGVVGAATCGLSIAL